MSVAARKVDPDELSHELRQLRRNDDCPSIVAIDGRSGSGKTTLAQHIAATAPDDIAIVSTDDFAWHHSFFGWSEIARSGVLEPLRTTGAPVHYRPQAWIDHHRPDGITVPRGTALLLLEGVGAGRKELCNLLDALVWVDTDDAISRTRLQQRGDTHGQPESTDFVTAWLRAESEFLRTDRPWERATFIIDNNG